jgi:hypothetical protein
MRVTESPARGPTDTRYHLLVEISDQISQAVDLQDVVRHLLEGVRAVVEYDAAGIFVLNRDVPIGPGPASDMIAAMATPTSRCSRQDPITDRGRASSAIIRTGRIVVAPDLATTTHYIEGRVDASEIAIRSSRTL